MAARAPLEAPATRVKKGLIAEAATGKYRKKDAMERRTFIQTAAMILAVSPWLTADAEAIVLPVRTVHVAESACTASA